MFAKFKGSNDQILNSVGTIGKAYQIFNHDLSDKRSLAVTLDNGQQWFMNDKIFRNHFEPVFSISASDFVFSHDTTEAPDNNNELFDSIAVMLNGIINENGGFACFNGADCQREFLSRI